MRLPIDQGGQGTHGVNAIEASAFHCHGSASGVAVARGPRARCYPRSPSQRINRSTMHLAFGDPRVGVARAIRHVSAMVAGPYVRRAVGQEIRSFSVTNECSPVSSFQ